MKLNTNINLTKVITTFEKKGFTKTFFFQNAHLKCTQDGKAYNQEDLKIVEYRRLSDDKNDLIQSVIFALECKDGDRGYIITSENNTQSLQLLKFMDKVKIKIRKYNTTSIKPNSSAA